jgi:hypothetical protein
MPVVRYVFRALAPFVCALPSHYPCASIARRDAVNKTASLARFAPTSRLRALLPSRVSAAPLFAGKHRLAAHYPDEPADVFYENLGVSIAERWARRSSLRLLQYCVIGLAFLLTSAAVSAKSKGEITDDCLQVRWLFFSSCQRLSCVRRTVHKECRALRRHGVAARQGVVDAVWDIQ